MSVTTVLNTAKHSFDLNLNPDIVTKAFTELKIDQPS